MNPLRRFLNRVRTRPTMIGTPPLRRPMWHDPVAHARQFASEYADRLEHYVEGRLHAPDIPEGQMGLPDLSRGIPWAVFHPNGTTSGSVIGEKFAVIAHEMAEAQTRTHEWAEALAADTDLAVSEGARRILKAMAGRGR